MTDPKASKNNPFKELGKIPKLKYKDGYSVQSIYIPIRDGLKIAATICLPKELKPNDKIPTLLTQTRYWRAMELRIPFRWILNETVTDIPNPEIITSRGYAYIKTDVRGTGASYGKRNVPFSDEEVKDGKDIIEWIISQPWSDGNVVAKGISYTGTTAELFSINNHSAIKAVMPGHGFWDPYTDVAYPGGVYDHAFMQLWSFLGKNLDINNPKVFRQIMPEVWLFVKGVKPVDNDEQLKNLKEVMKLHHSNNYVYKHTIDKDFRDEQLSDGVNIADVSIYKRKEQIEKSGIPILAWCSWLDSGYVDAIIHRFLNVDNPMIAILGDWNHGAHLPANQFFPDRTKVIPSPREKINAWMNFFDKCVYGKGIQDKTLYYYTMVEEQWKKTAKWPPEGHSTLRFYLSENNSLSTEKPDNEDGEDEYKINFRATTGRNNRWWALLGLPIVYDNRAKMDEKLLCYTSEPFKEDTEITGQAIISLFLTSTHEDGAIFIYLEDVDEGGHVTYITDGQFRVIHRKISDEIPPYKTLLPYHTYKEKDAMPLIQGEVAEIRFGLHATSVLIKKGHRIKIAIAGGDRDTFSTYPREGRPTIRVSRNNKFSSYIDLPIIKSGK
jgi:putative CocE/NonD family hydrolase